MEAVQELDASFKDLEDRVTLQLLKPENVFCVKYQIKIKLEEEGVHLMYVQIKALPKKAADL